MDGAYAFEWTVEDRVRAVIALNSMLHIDKVRPEDRLADLGLDSLGVVETIFGLEEAFDIQIPFNANDTAGSGKDLSTVGAVIALVRELVAAK